MTALVSGEIRQIGRSPFNRSLEPFPASLNPAFLFNHSLKMIK